MHFIDYKNLKRTIFFIFVTLLLQSCSSVPLSSMVKLASFDESDLLNIDPNAVRARLTLTEPAELETRNVQLALRFEYAGDKEQEYAFILKPVSVSKAVKESWFSKDVLQHRYVFEIDEQSIQPFKSYQREFLKYGKPSKYYWTVYYHIKKNLPQDKISHLDLELKLAKKEDYFFLLKDAEIKVD